MKPTNLSSFYLKKAMAFLPEFGLFKTISHMGWFFYALIFITPFLSACKKEAPQYTSLSDLEGGKTFAVPTGTVADQFVLDRFPDAKLLYYNSVLDCALAVKNRMADAAIYDLPVLKNIAGKNEGIVVLEELLTPDNYGFAVRLDNRILKMAIDEVVSEAKADGTYRKMLDRWFPDQGEPGPLPTIESTGEAGVLLFGTAAITEPMAYYDKDRQITGFDIELALRVAKKLNKRLEVIDLEFGALLPALISGRVEMIGAGMSITEERAKSVLFSESYYEGGIAALVRASGDVDTGAGAGKLQSVEDIAHRKLGVLMGSIYDGYANKNYPEAKILTFNTVPDMLTALSAGKVDAVFADQTRLKDVFANYAGLGVLEEYLFFVDMGTGFRKTDGDLRMQFNDFLRKIRNDGTYDDMKHRWFDEMSEAMPAISTAGSSDVLRVGVVGDIGLPMTGRTQAGLVGFDVELANRFAAYLGKEVVLTDLPFASLLPALVSGRIDMIAASMMITEERQKQIDFSDGYMNSGASVLVRAEDLVSDTRSLMDDRPTPFFEKVTDSFYNNIIREQRYRLILSGLYVTILISIFAALFGTVLGGIICFMRMSKTRMVNRSASLFISLIRGTPVLVLLMIIYYVIFASWNISPVLVAVIAFGINFAAYVSEMFRSSILSIDYGQKEAGIASGFTKIQTFIHIIMPQALQRVLPVYKGEFISLLKMTSIVGYIAVQDLTKASDIIRSRTFDAFFPLIMAAVIYICLAWLLTIVLDRIEIGVDPKKRRTKKMKEVML
jgi:polar amino acid transport system substrate-binding protein